MEPSQAPNSTKMSGPNRPRQRRRRVPDAAPLLLPLDTKSQLPLHRQIYEGLRAGILTGRFAANMRLPSSRVLASELGVARNTVVLAFDQLSAEGYLSTRRGGGTRVRAGIPDSLINVHADRADRRDSERRPSRRFAPGARVPAPRSPARIPARWTRALADFATWGAGRDADAVPFALGMPA